MTEYEKAMLEESRLQTKILLEIQNAANKGEPPRYEHKRLSDKEVTTKMIILTKILIGVMLLFVVSFYQAYG